MRSETHRPAESSCRLAGLRRCSQPASEDRRMRLLAVVALSMLLSACASSQPENTDDLCAIFREKAFWYRESIKAEQRWNVPVSVMLAFIHQESHFRARAKPPRRKFLWIFPGRRASNAKGYAQAINDTWKMYRKATGRSLLANRTDFSDAVDFIGWYNNESAMRLNIDRSDAYKLYLAYHEGWGGYASSSWLEKTWLSPVARRVSRRAQKYQRQLDGCASSLRKSHWLFRPLDLFKR